MIGTRRLRTAVVAAVGAITVTIAGCGGPAPSGTSPEDLPTSHEELVAMAQQEGEVVLGGGGHTRPQAELLAQMFEEEYGIPVRFLRESSGDIAQKVAAQSAAQALQFDVISLNNEATLRTWAADEVLAEPALENREQVIGRLDTGGAPYVPFTWAAMGYSYNQATTDPVAAPKTWEQLGQQQVAFAVADPGSSGAALTFVAAMQQIDPDFLPALADNKTLVTDSALALTQLIAVGEAAYGLPGIEAAVATARQAGEPLAMGYPEGPLGVLPSYIAALAQAPHPAAARLLLQYQLSEEFQRAQVELGSRSVLRDLPAPEGAVQLTEDRLVVIDPEQLEKQQEQLVAEFANTMGA